MHSFFANISHLKGKYMKVEEGEEISIKVVQLYQYHVPVHLFLQPHFIPVFSASTGRWVGDLSQMEKNAFLVQSEKHAQSSKISKLYSSTISSVVNPIFLELLLLV